MFTEFTAVLLSALTLMSTTATTAKVAIYSEQSETNKTTVETAQAETYTAYGYVIDELFEGYSEYDDIYLVEVDGIQYEIESDDFLIGDPATVYFSDSKPVRMIYGWR